MRKALVTICVGERYRMMSEVTHPLMRAYADRVCAEFIVWEDFAPHTHPAYQKLEIAELLKTFDRVMFVDTDVMIRADAPDLFQEVPADCFGAFNEFPFVPRSDAMMSFVQDEKWLKRGKYFNTGVFVCSKIHRDIFRPAIPEVNNFFEQTYLNYMIFREGVKTVDLFHKFNRMSCMDKITGESRHDSFLLHYAGCGLPDDEIVNLMRGDLQAWVSNPSGVWPRNIFVNCGGGIGDVVAAEPVVRHLREGHFPEDNVFVQTHFPEIFTHLDGVKIRRPGEPLVDQGFYEIDLMPGDNHPLYGHIVHANCHPTDYASICAIKGQISNTKKQIKLDTTNHSIGSAEENLLRERILLHPGKGWASKTFPKEWWNELIDAIVHKGRKVALIGKTVNEEQGFVDVDGRCTLDLRDKLDLRSLFRAIELAPVLISNDSAPIHIAGAFDNWIGLIATCKPPFRILPFRHGVQGYKAENLSKKIIPRVDSPNHPYYVGIHTAAPGELEECLPTPARVADWAVEKFLSATKAKPDLRVAMKP